jgi:hypothetical protein
MSKPRLNATQLKIYQAGLAELGGYKGEIDGKWGDLSEAAEQRALAALSEPEAFNPIDDTSHPATAWWSGPARYANATAVRHLNPGNIKRTRNPWRGQIGSDSRGHVIFSAPELGARALAYQLRVNQNKHGLDTVAKQLARWAPTTDTIGSLPGAPPNSPREYALFVQDVTGIAPNAKLRLFKGDRPDDLEQLVAFMSAIAEYETGRGFKVNPWVLKTGVSLL